MLCIGGAGDIGAGGFVGGPLADAVLPVALLGLTAGLFCRFACLLFWNLEIKLRQQWLHYLVG